MEYNHFLHTIEQNGPHFKGIFEAAEKGTVEDVKYFVEKKGLDVNAINFFNDSPLHFAARNFNIEIAKYLISQGGKLNAKSEDGMTPLHIAVMCCNMEVVKYFISKGVDTNAQKFDWYGEGCGPPLDYAKTEEIKSILLEASGRLPDNVKWSNIADVNTMNSEDKTLLDMAKTEQITSVLRNADASNLENNNSESPSRFQDIFEAVEKGTVEEVKYFVEKKGLGVNVRKGIGETLLHIAASKNPNTDVIEYLVSQGIDVNEASGFEECPLHCAARNFNIEIVKYLISQGAKMNAQDEDGQTPLHFAVGCSNKDVVKYLISKGADGNLSGFFYPVRPLDLAKTEEIKSILRDAGGKQWGK